MSQPPPRKVLSSTGNGQGESHPDTEDVEPRTGRPRKDPPQKKVVPEAYYDDGSMTFWLETPGKQHYARVHESVIKRDLKIRGFNSGEKNGLPSEIDERVQEIILTKLVKYAGPLAGFTTGLYQMMGLPILVSSNPIILEATHGENGFMYEYIERLLGDKAIYFHAWVKMGREALLARNLRSGQAMIIVGEPDHGKSLLGKMCADMLGGRVSDPTQFLIGETQFNAHLFGTELLFMDDPEIGDDYATRRRLSGGIKQIVAGAFPQCHGKGRTPITITPLWRLLIALNDEPETIQVLPPMDRGIKDKIIILETVARAITERTVTSTDYAAYEAKLRAAIPDYLGWLDRWVIPKEYCADRFSIKVYHSPRILGMLQEFSPETKLMHLILEEIQSSEERTMTAREIEAELKQPGGSGVEHEARNLLRGTGSCGKYLVRMCNAYPKIIRKAGKQLIKKSGKTGSGVMQYVISAKAVDCP